MHDGFTTTETISYMGVRLLNTELIYSVESTHTHTHIYIFIYIYVRRAVSLTTLSTVDVHYIRVSLVVYMFRNPTHHFQLNCLIDTYDCLRVLTHWGRVTYICVGNLTIIGPDNGLSPGRRRVIIWTNARILLIEPRAINFSEILFGIHTFSFKKFHLKMSSAKWRPFCLGLNVFLSWYSIPPVYV